MIDSSARELERSLDRPDAERLIGHIDRYIALFQNGADDASEEWAETQYEILASGDEDPEKALAYVVLAAARTDDAGFLAMIAAGPLEDALRNPTEEFLVRVVREARRSARFRWLLSVPFRVAVSERAWSAIRPFRLTGDHEEPSRDHLPPR